MEKKALNGIQTKVLPPSFRGLQEDTMAHILLRMVFHNNAQNKWATTFFFLKKDNKNCQTQIVLENLDKTKILILQCYMTLVYSLFVQKIIKTT